MNKRKRSYHYTSNPYIHQYGLGDDLKKSWGNFKDVLSGNSDLDGIFAKDFENLNGTSNTKKRNPGLGQFMIGIADKALNPEGNTSDVGNFIGGAGQAISMIPGLQGYGLAIQGIGKLFNAAFGSNVNQKDVERVRAQAAADSSALAGAGNWDELQNSWNAAAKTATIGGSQGWFNHDLDKANERALAQVNNALNSAQTASANISTNELRNMQNNFMAEGGNLIGTDYDINLSFINNGGTHEQNALGGVPFGMAPDGKMNQVEEGEVVFNDYVYSNRIPVPKAIRNKYKMRDTKDLSFADAVKKYVDKNGIDERENDPIAMRGFEAFASDMAQEQERIKAEKEAKEMANSFALGGHKYDNGSKLIGTTGKTSGQLWNDYTFSGLEKLFNDAYARYQDVTSPEEQDQIRNELINTINSVQNSYAGIYRAPGTTAVYDPKVKEHQILFGNVGGNYGFTGIDNDINRTYRGHTADNAAGGFGADGLYGWRTGIRHFGTDADEESVDNMATLAGIADQMGLNWSPNLAYGDTGNKLYMLSLGAKPATIVEEPTIAPEETALPSGKNADKAEALKKKQSGTGYDPTYWWNKNAGLMANMAGLAYNMFDPYKPPVLNEIGPFSPIGAGFIGDYMRFAPYDLNYAANLAGSQNAVTRSALMQSNAPGRAASLIANDYAGMLGRGNTYRQALEYNDQFRKAVADFNRETNKFNLQMALDASTKNQAARQNYYESLLNQAAFNVSNNIKHKMAKDQAIGQGLTSIGDWFDALRREGVAEKGLGVFASTMPTGNATTKDYLAQILGKNYTSSKNDKSNKLNKKGGK